jgi:hypothetical protein
LLSVNPDESRFAVNPDAAGGGQAFQAASKMLSLEGPSSKKIETNENVARRNLGRMPV